MIFLIIIIGIYEYSIINTIFKFPFYILYINKKTKEKKILINYNNMNRIFKLSSNNKKEKLEDKKNIGNNNVFELEKYYDEFNKITNVNTFLQENIIVLCYFKEKTKIRKIKYDDNYDYNI